eukprot:s2908_g9.t1
MTSHTLVAHGPPVEDLPHEIPLKQVVEHFDKDAIFHQLNTVWGKYWQRDDPHESMSAADQQILDEVLSALPPQLAHIVVEQGDLQRWTAAINSTKPTSAPGVDGVRASELQIMPPALIQSLIDVVTKEPGIMPPCLMQGRWIEHPVIYAHPLQDFILQLHERMPTVEVSEDAKHILHNVSGQGLTLYSDASCLFQSHPTTRYASFALIADLASDDATRLQQADRFLATGQEPDTLQPIVQGRVQGRQGIHRAELSAIVVACEGFSGFNLHTDSATTLAAIDRVRQAQHPSEFEDHPDFDLLLRLFQALQPTHVFHKIKAHVTLESHPCNLQLYHQLGNKKANDVAIAANSHLFPEAVREFNQFHADVLAEQKSLACVYDYVIALQMVKIKVDLQNPHTAVAEQCRLHTTDPCKLFSEWMPDEYWTAPRPVQGQGLEMCPYGQQVAYATLKFLMKCQWPTQQFGPLPEPVGISWLEIGLAIMLELGAYLPVKRQREDGSSYPVFLHTYADAMLHHTTMTEQSEQARYIFGHVNDLVPERLYPDVIRGQVKSLCLMGDSYFTTGLMLRPAFPHQQQVMTMIKQYLMTNRSVINLNFTKQKQWQIDLAKADWEWNRRLHEAQMARRRVRLARRRR